MNLPFLRTLAFITPLITLNVSVAAGKDNGNASPVIVGTGAHPHAATPVAPTLSGATGGVHPGTGQYHPTVGTGPGGVRTYVYPGVHTTAVHHSFHSSSSLGTSNVSTGFQHAGNSPNSSALVSPRIARRHIAGVSISPSAGNSRLNSQTSMRLRNWKGNPSSYAQAQQRHADHCHHHHDHDWWKDHCFAIVFFDWGFWGWDDGWWYPAWGYDPYSYYAYNEPIYGYGGLSPDQIVADVQSALQQEGYFSYAVDGVMGPLTKSAIATYQRDHRLPITYAIDPATLASLGLIMP